MFEIVAIKKPSFTYHTSEIQAVKLKNGETLSVQEVIFAISAGQSFFYTTTCNSRAYVEVVTPLIGKQYIRTKSNTTTSDNLLNLPKF